MSTIETKIAEVEVGLYRTVQVLDWAATALQVGWLPLDELQIHLDSVAINPKSLHSLVAWAGVDVIAEARHAPGNNAIYTFQVPEVEVRAYVFVRDGAFGSWDGRRHVVDENLCKRWPERSLRDDLVAYQAWAGSRGVTA